MDDQTKAVQEHELLLRKWKHRRRLAYISLFAAMTTVVLIVILAISGSTGELNEFNSVLIVSISGFISLVGAYMGLSTWKD